MIGGVHHRDRQVKESLSRPGLPRMRFAITEDRSGHHGVLSGCGSRTGGWGLSAGRLSLVLAHRQFISLGQQQPNFRFKRLVAGVEHAHPVHPAIYRMGII